MKSQTKPDLVILEGPDKAGKSTIYQAFRRATSYQPLVIDRFIGSNIVYDQLHGRTNMSSDTVKEYYRTEDRLLETFNPLVVYLYAPVGVLLKRSMLTGEYHEEKFDIKNVGWYYERYLENTPLEVMKIDTQECPVDVVVKAIQWQLEHRKKEVRNQWSA